MLLYPRKRWYSQAQADCNFRKQFMTALFWKLRKLARTKSDSEYGFGGLFGSSSIINEHRHEKRYLVDGLVHVV